MFTSIEETAEYENYNCMQSLEEYDEANGWNINNQEDRGQDEIEDESMQTGDSDD